MAEARRLYKARGFSLKGIVFKKNESCGTAHMSGCGCERLIACSPGLEPYVPELPRDYLHGLRLVEHVSPERQKVRDKMMRTQHLD